MTVSYPGASERVFSVVQAAAGPAPFVIDVKEIKATSFTVDFIPSDPEMTYVFQACTQEYIDEKGLHTDDAIFQDDLEYMGIDLEYFAVSGEVTGAVFNALPEIEYVVYAYGVDVETSTRLTDIVYERFVTPGVEKIEADFTIEATANGPEVTAKVTPQGYDGYYYCEAYEHLDPDVSLYELCYDNFMRMLSSYESFGLSANYVRDLYCRQGESDWVFSLKPSTDYTLVAYAISDDVVPCSDPVTFKVSTGVLEPSDNQLTITVSDITSRSAKLQIEATNDDTYGLFVVKTEEIAGYTTDNEVMEYLSSWYYPTECHGYYEEDMIGLSAETGYSVCAFGILGKYATTGLFRTDLTTAEAVEGAVTMEVAIDDYFDLEESLDVLYDIDSEIGAEIDLAIEEGLETMMFYHVETNNPAEADEFYFGLYPYVEGMFDGVSDQDMINELMSYYPSDPEGIYLMYYDDPMIFIGVATDKDGNPGPVYYGEPFTLTRDGVADPEGLKDLFGVAAATKAPVNTEFSVVRKNMPAPERFSVRKDVEAPVAKVYDEPVVVAPSNVELSDANAAQNVRVVRSFYRK